MLFPAHHVLVCTVYGAKVLVLTARSVCALPSCLWRIPPRIIGAHDGGRSVTRYRYQKSYLCCHASLPTAVVGQPSIETLSTAAILSLAAGSSFTSIQCFLRRRLPYMCTFSAVRFHICWLTVTAMVSSPLRRLCYGCCRCY